MMEISVIVTAMKTGERNGKIGVDQRQAGLTAIVARLYTLKGMGGNAQQIAPEIHMAVQELEKEVALKYPFFTLAEVRYALEAGVKGEWDDQPTYLNVANYCKWLKAYRDSAARMEAAQSIENGTRIAPAQQIEAGTVQTRNEEASKKLLAQCIEEVRTFGQISAEHLDGGLASLYDYLRATGQMERPAPAAIQEAMHRAAQQKARGNNKEKSIGQIIQEGSKTVAVTAKRYLLEEYIKTL